MFISYLFVYLTLVTVRHYSNKDINKVPIMKVEVEPYWIYRDFLFKDYE